MNYTTNAEPINKCVHYRGNYVGMRFGQLIVLGYPTKNGIRRAGAVCKCDCGNEYFVGSMGPLLNGKVFRCAACGRRALSESKKRWHKEHPQLERRGPFYAYRDERLYKVWLSMKGRCKSKTGCYYDVNVCDEWQDYLVFREWAYSHGYDDKAPRGQCTIDRINPFGNYEPSNCRFTDMTEQARNKRKRWMNLDEETREMLLATARN